MTTDCVGSQSPIAGNTVAEKFFENEPDWSLKNIFARIQADLAAGFGVVVKNFGWFMYQLPHLIPHTGKIVVS